ncbi:MAG: energy-coupling factor transporter transmembrane protein EcfT [Candidatus Dormibacteraeota bacterium]|nr:energy-coupling factor transporter transmembrane protein EcfT [Candidatus Dormibacteraeota bacterium]
MTPRIWAAWTASALVVVLTSTNPVYRGLVLLVALDVLLTFRRRDATLRPLFIAVGVAAALAALINTLLSHTGVHTLFTLPAGIPGIGGPVTADALVYGLDVALGISAAVLAAAPLGRVLHPHDLLDAFPRALQRTAALVGSALNLVPGMARNAVQISEAQRMRGVRGTRLRDLRAVAAPIVLSALDDSLQLAEAMEARGFGSRTRTSYTTHRVDRHGVFVLVAAAVAGVLVVVARATGSVSDWYPFPAAVLPDVALLPLLACLLLAAPLLPWRRS